MMFSSFMTGDILCPALRITLKGVITSRIFLLFLARFFMLALI